MLYAAGAGEAGLCPNRPPAGFLSPVPIQPHLSRAVSPERSLQHTHAHLYPNPTLALQETVIPTSQMKKLRFREVSRTLRGFYFSEPPEDPRGWLSPGGFWEASVIGQDQEGLLRVGICLQAPDPKLLPAGSQLNFPGLSLTGTGGGGQEHRLRSPFHACVLQS